MIVIRVITRGPRISSSHGLNIQDIDAAKAQIKTESLNNAINQNKSLNSFVDLALVVHTFVGGESVPVEPVLVGLSSR